MTTQEKIDFLQRIIDKDSSLVYEDIVIKAMSQSKSVNYLKRVEKIANPLKYIDPKKLSINQNASQQMKGLWKSLNRKLTRLITISTIIQNLSTSTQEQK